MSSTSTTLETLCCVTLFTYFGALSRMTLTTLSSSLNSELLPNFIGSFFLANILGSFVMGLFVPFLQLFKPNYYAWYIGVTTGYCGSCTTFSTWQRISADVMVNGRIVDGLMTSLLTFCTSYTAFLCGKHISEEIYERYVKRYTETMSTSDASLRCSVCRFGILLKLTILLTVVLWIGVVLDTTTEYRRRWWVAAALGPIGSLARYWLLLYNRNWPSFPLFTFLVNVCASVIGAAIFAVYLRLCDETINDEWLNEYDLWLNTGVGAGILGCLSTVSTFVNELHRLADTNILHAYRYGLLSLFVAQILCVKIFCTKFL